MSARRLARAAKGLVASFVAAVALVVGVSAGPAAAGLDPAFPAVEVNNPSVFINVWDSQHHVVGTMGGSRLRTNVTCYLVRSNGTWFRRLNSDIYGVPVAYVSAADVHLFYEPYPTPQCPPSNDQPGPRICPRPWVGCYFPDIPIYTFDRTPIPAPTATPVRPGVLLR